MSQEKPLGSIIFQNRDSAFLRDLFESRVMTIAHAAALHFDGSKDAAKKRLYKLKAAGFISERRRKSTEPSVLFLNAKAFAHLRGQGVLREYPSFSAAALEKRARVSEITLRHELEVMDVKAAFHSAIRKIENFSIAEFGTWPRIYQFEVNRNHTDILIRPDGFIRIREKEKDDGLSEYVFFLEVDRSSESLNTLVTKAACYLTHYQSGGFALKNGATREKFKEYPFRVLIVCKTAERRNNIAIRLLQNNPPIFTHTHLTTLAEATTDSLGPIWITPATYRDAVAGTPFDTNRLHVMHEYRRQAEREIQIEKNIKKSAIVDQIA